MAIHVYITDQCKKDIDRQQYTSIIRAFKDKIEKTQHSGVFDRFPPPYCAYWCAEAPNMPRSATPVGRFFRVLGNWRRS
jgi:hypothetical protein